MFQKLRLKLTAINVSIILSLFFILIVGAYFVSRYDMSRRVAFIAERIAADVQALPGEQPRIAPPGSPPPGPPLGPPSKPPPGSPQGPSFFFVKTSPAGAITYQSANQPLEQGDLADLTAQSLRTGDRQGRIDQGEAEYVFLKAPLRDEPGYVIVFHDQSQDQEKQMVLLTALMIVGAICALLSFGASFIMAERAMLPIRQAWQQQKDFLSDASHELRSPLAVIQTNLEVVRIKPDETVASQVKWLDNIQEEVAYMTKLVDALLFLARAESEQQVLVRRLFSLNNALVRAIVPFEAVAAARGVVLEVEAAPVLDVYGDEGRIKQVVGILLDNALRHTPAGGKVVVSLIRTESRVVVAVADSGEGIGPEHLDKVFDRFYQVDRARAKGGAGLGLAIAKRIVESHGGAITVTSTPGRGATFRFWLPLDSHR